MDTIDGAWFYKYISEGKGYPHGLVEKVKMAAMMATEVFFYMHCETHTQTRHHTDHNFTLQY